MKRFLDDQCTCFCLTTDRLCTSVFCFQIVQFTEIKCSGIADIHTCRIFAIFDQVVAKITFFTFFNAFINGRCAKRTYLCTCSATDAGVPTTVFIDKNGKVVGEAVVGAKVEEYKQHVEDYLNEQK